jgi:hypothetical protein
MAPQKSRNQAAMKAKRIWMVDPGFSSFVRKDREILEKKFRLDHYHYRASKNPVDFAVQMLKLLVASLWFASRSDLVYIWFADYHSIIPAITAKCAGKKVVVVTGGFDAVAIPQLSYGVFVKNNFRSWCASKTYKLADLVLPVDASLAEGLNNYADQVGKGLPVGIRKFVRNLKSRIEVLPTGYNPDIWKRNTEIFREASVLSLAFVAKDQTFKLKGFDLLIETARLLPQVPFTLAGITPNIQDKYRNQLPPNVQLIGAVPYHELPDLYSRHKVYAQLSLSEGLPNSLCEAMLCECVPVGSLVNGIPTAIGEAGFLLGKQDFRQAATLITKALETDDQSGIAARNQIIRNFPERRREERLLILLDETL